MNLEQIWGQLERRHQKLKDPSAELRITSAALKKLLGQVYDQARRPADDNLDFIKTFRDNLQRKSRRMEQLALPL